MLVNTNKLTLRHQEQGFASIVIALVLILVLSLITVGFAQLMNREQKSALDKQVSAQAYYAAESGVNDAAKALNAGYAANKTTCGPLPLTDTNPGATYLQNNNISNSTDSKYTCLLLDPTPMTLEYSSINPITVKPSKVVEISGINPADGTPAIIGSIHIGWQDANSGNTFVPGASGNQFYPAASWPATTPVLRIGLTPLSSGHLNRSDLVNDNYLAYLYPNGAGALPTPPAYSSFDSTGSGAGGIINGNCNISNSPTLPEYCNVNVKDLNSVNYLLDMGSIYRNSRVTITAYAFDGTQLAIKNAQTLVDSTGKSQDVLRRIQVRLPSHNTYDHPDADLETTGNICKQLQLLPPVSGSNSSGCTP